MLANLKTLDSNLYNSLLSIVQNAKNDNNLYKQISPIIEEVFVNKLYPTEEDKWEEIIVRFIENNSV
jgi:hypothetical protein